MKQIGIWMDKEKAHLVSLLDGKVSFSTILSNIETNRDHVASGTRLKEGSQEVILGRKYLEREKQQFKKYFNNLASEIKDADNIVLFGPAETGFNFKKELNTSYKDLSTKVQDVVKADSMTKGQTIAWVKDFFT